MAEAKKNSQPADQLFQTFPTRPGGRSSTPSARRSPPESVRRLFMTFRCCDTVDWASGSISPTRRTRTPSWRAGCGGCRTRTGCATAHASPASTSSAFDGFTFTAGAGVAVVAKRAGGGAWECYRRSTMNRQGGIPPPAAAGGLSPVVKQHFLPQGFLLCRAPTWPSSSAPRSPT